MLFVSLILGLVSSALAVTHSGDGTFTTFGLGACGFTNDNSQLVVGVSTAFYNDFPNPICGRTITATFQGKSVTVEVVDKCTGCAMFDLNFSPAAFDKLANESVGRIHNVSWQLNGGGE
ncbi:hypothetical protein SISSUDRAFT_1036034 [Sistotremastrum suecicum HHB10207 ss-3]|uniref:RlpA-like protein double-psi beta-barrel domain-containing protein n=1 Tax=Sistotremastrum suecicum HHB10207 ss-3 TaxID=1314776 RepID=A0A165ZZN9_9AGAM|nr:hypothetical protein SISSUDRAFT_1036034 [Sistotremastrum suecicum HHB10207 ss-3]